MKMEEKQMDEMMQKQQAGRTVPLNEVKVVFLGDGEAGKSHTIARLMNDGKQVKNFWGVSTPGIVIEDKDYPIGGRQVKVHYWDFGGQEILHSMHRLFLTQRTLYVVLVNVREGNQDDRARYWLHTLKSFAGGAPVLLVLNKMDMNRNATVNEKDLRMLYPGLTEVVKLSTLTYSDERFKSEFIDVLMEQIAAMDILDLPLSAAARRVKERLQTMPESYIHGDVFRQICDECGVEGNDAVRRDLLEQLGQLGISFYYNGSMELEDHVVLRPDWLTSAIFIILFNKIEAVNNGRISHETIYQLLNSTDMESIRRIVTASTYKREDVDYVLKVFRKLRLSFQVEDGLEFLPMLCDANPTAAAMHYGNDPDALEFRMYYEYLPNDVIYCLMAERQKELDLDNVWLTGARFISGDRCQSAVVKSEGNLIRIMVRSEDGYVDSQAYLDGLKADIDRINVAMGLTVSKREIVYKQDGKWECFDYDSLVLMRFHEQSRVLSKTFRKMIPVEDILYPKNPTAQRGKKLADDIIEACAALQDFPLPRREDDINTCLKLLLEGKGYQIADPDLLMATGLGGKRRAAPDLFLADDQQNPLTLIEAINIRRGSMVVRYCEEHLDKLLHQYNTLDLSPLFLVCYVDCTDEEYPRLWMRYREHMYRYTPERSELLYGSYTELTQMRPHLNIASCRYLVNGKAINVYHLFVRVATAEYNTIPRELIEHAKSQQKQLPQEPMEPAGSALLPQQPVAEPIQPQRTGPILRDYRVVFLGDSEAGKSLIRTRLENPEMDPKDFHDNTTIGIDILRKEETINGQPVRLNYWDFGGQDILHSMHRIFLARNTLYVIVLNTRNDNQDAQAIFWLRYVEAYAPGSPVLLVMNKTDQNKRAALNLPVLNRLFYPREFDPEDVLKISAAWPDKEKFRKEFTEKLHACIGRYLGTAKAFTPQETRIRDRVEEKKAAEQLKVISLDDFRDICEEESLDDEDAQDALMKRFNETGVLVYFQGKTVMFMNPEWITRTIYKILDQDEQISDNGVVQHKKIKSFCRKNEDNINKSEDAAHLLEIMRDYDLSFWYEKQKPGGEHTEDKEFIPMLCQREEPQDMKTLIEQDNTVELRMVFEYLPCGVLYKLMVDHHNELDMEHVWRTGMKLDRENGSYAVVRQEGNAMGIYVHDPYVSRGIEWMIKLKDQVTEAAKHNKFHALLLETKIAYRISGVKEYFDYQQLKNAEESSLYYTVSRSRPPQKVAIRDILAQKDGTALEQIREMLKLTSAGCQELQKQQTYWFLAKDAKDERTHPAMDEDARTEVLRMKLSSAFTVKPQSRAGDSSTGKKQGELDLRIELDECTTIAILEALNITGYSTETQEDRLADLGSFTRWREHLERVVRDYNKEGIKNLLLVSYLDCPVEQTVQTREKYFERLKNHMISNFGSPKYCEPIVVDEFTDGIHVVRADYTSGAGSVTVYHFLVRIEQYDRKRIN